MPGPMDDLATRLLNLPPKGQLPEGDGPPMSVAEGMAHVLSQLAMGPLAPLAAADAIQKSVNETDPVHQAAREKYGDVLQGAIGPNGELVRPGDTEQALNQIINSRDVVYHNTTPSRFENIVKTGQIDPAYNMSPGEAGVSVSRIPIKGFDRGITLVIPKDKLPSNTPIAEGGFQKTVGTKDWWDTLSNDELEAYNKASAKNDIDTAVQIRASAQSRIPRKMNPSFEYELRTKNQSIPLSSVRNVISNIDKADTDPAWVNSLLGGRTTGVDAEISDSRHLNRLSDTKDMLRQLLMIGK